jgi:hypothetical protein
MERRQIYSLWCRYNNSSLKTRFYFEGVVERGFTMVIESKQARKKGLQPLIAVNPYALW